MRRFLPAALFLALISTPIAYAQSGDVLALTCVAVIDGTGAPPMAGMTIVFAAPLAAADSVAVTGYFARERARMNRVLRGGVTTVGNMAGERGRLVAARGDRICHEYRRASAGSRE